jgi:hypothetical protein
LLAVVVVWLLIQPVRICDLRHARGAHQIVLVVDRVSSHCNGRACEYPTVGHYVTAHGTVDGVHVYPNPDHEQDEPIQAIISPAHPRIAVPTDAHGYYHPAFGLFLLVTMGTILYIAFRFANERSETPGPT